MNMQFMREAIGLANESVKANKGGPFGAVVVKDGVVIGRGSNEVTALNDPTSHAEIMAIRDACNTLGSFQLDGCEIYSSCEPCPMCLGAIYWARPDKLYYACSHSDAAQFGFDDSYIYDELSLPANARTIQTEQHMREEGLSSFKLWEVAEKKVPY